jgi:hypothetical protein
MADPDSSYAPRSPDLSAFDQPAYSTEHAQSWSAPQSSLSFSDPNARQSYQPEYSTPAYHPSNTLDPSYPQQYPSYPQPAQFHESYHQEPAPFQESYDGMKEEDPEWASEAPVTKSRGSKQKAANIPSRPVVDVTRGIDVKTKFPVARIKRIMQADEDVGKVAQVTPVVVGKSFLTICSLHVASKLVDANRLISTAKALEIFMISLVCKAAEEAKDRGSKRVTAVHLKQAIVEDDQFDFLQEKVSKVPDAPAPVEREEDGDEGGDRKRKKRVARKKATDSDEG